MKNVLPEKGGNYFISTYKNLKKRPYVIFNQTLRVMKLATILILGAFMQVSANGFSQFVTLNETNSSLNKVFTEIRKQTGYDFLYNTKLLKNTVLVTVKTKNSRLEEALKQVFQNQPLTYFIAENTIILKEKDGIFTVQTFRVGPPPGEQVIKKNSNYFTSDQKADIRGRVTDAKGEGLIGVSVKVKGAAIGVSTDVQGNFALNVPANAILVFTYVGYVTQEVVTEGKTSINVTLVEDHQTLNEVVVTALGVTKEKRGLGYSVQEVKGKDFTEARMNNVASSLTGKIAGVDATQINAGPGASSRVIIRGNTSLNGNQQPLYVVDGMPINNSPREPTYTGGLNVDRGDGVSSMNPDDIASISVLKGGAAAALYGSQAANGVILITTKKGSQQKGVGIEVTSDANFGTPSVFPNYQYIYGAGMDGVKPATVAAAMSSNRLNFGAKIDDSMVMQFDGVMRPYSAVNIKQNILNYFQTSQNITNTVAFNAGNENMQLRFSVSDLRAKDQQPNSEYFRKTANLNIRGKMGKNNFMTIESGVQYNIVQGVNRPNLAVTDLSSAGSVYRLSNTVDVRNLKGADPARPGIDVATGRELLWNPVSRATNPYFTAYQIGNKDDQQRIIGRASVQVNILSGLFVKGTVAKDFSYYNESNYIPMTDAFMPLGYFNSAQERTDKTNFQAIANYNRRFLGEKIGFNLMVGADQERNSNRNNTANGSQWVIPDFYSTSNLANRDLVNLGQTASGTNSLFGEANLDYKKFLYLTVTGRQDWFSVLNPGFNSIFYPSLQGGLILSDVVKLPEIFNYAKLRSSWAQVGSATVNAGNINQTYTISTVNAYGLPTLSNPNTLQNPHIRPITATTIEGGFEVQMLGNRLGLDVNYYSRRTTNDILSPPISEATGYAAGKQNLGLITNKGWEISLTGTPVKKTDFNWDVRYNFSYNQSKIVELAEGISVLSLGSGAINAVGLPYSTIRRYVMKTDANGTLVYNKATGYADRVLQDLGVGNPPYLLGLSNTFRYKRFSLIVDMDSKFGAVGFSYLMQYATRFGATPITLAGRENGLTLTGVDQTGAPYNKVWPVVDLDTYYDNFGTNYDGQFVYKTDFVKLRRAVLKYDLPINTLKFMKVQSASIGVTGLNLLTLYQDKRTKEAGIDPEMQETVGNAQGYSGISQPKTRNIGFNLNLKF
ncbi:MAG: TonB-dependent receptor plug [Sphingobacteriales bacterium]|nr:TonB-dependent receptor plug [Sphingobacteriales bacterium]